MRSYALPVRAVLYREDGDWVAHCLEFDLCGNGATPEESLKSLTVAMMIQIEHSLQEDNPANLFQPADGKFFQMFAAGKNIAVGALELKGAVNGFEIEGVEAREYAEPVGEDLISI